MADEVVLGGPKQWKAISHPLRHKLIRLLAKKEMTNEELAKEIGVPSGQLHYHTKKLLEAGLIELAGTRQKGPLTEKLYRKVGEGFTIPRRDDGQAPAYYHFIQNALEAYQTTWEEAPGHEFAQSAFHIFRYLLPEDEKRIYARLGELMKELDEAGVALDTPGAHLVSIAALAHRMQEE
ncbi:hypothetical protein BH11ARM1_BH11ARM1_10820 [soil metagenome]